MSPFIKKFRSVKSVVKTFLTLPDGAFRTLVLVTNIIQRLYQLLLLYQELLNIAESL